MQAKTCMEAFDEGEKFSHQHTRTQGGYKLAERLRQWEQCEREVCRIASAVKHPSARYDLMHCTYEDKHLWLSRILKIIAYELSASIIPSFKALTGDGMSKADIDRHLTQVERRCMEVLQELERARLNIKPISREYERMRHGKSVVGDALVHARETLEEIIGLTPPDIQNQICPTVQEVQCEI
jgi:hypothetical protein